MKSIAQGIRLQFNADMKPEIIVTLQSRSDLEPLNELKAATDNCKMLDVEIKVHRKHRSLDANGCLWAILGKMAEVLRTSKDEIYLLMLERYGVFTHIIVKKEAVERIKAEWRTVRELGEGKIGSGIGIQLQVYYGSSVMNTKEFSHLLDGVISEAREIGVDTITPEERESLLSGWGK